LDLVSFDLRPGCVRAVAAGLLEVWEFLMSEAGFVAAYNNKKDSHVRG
jgi:hypothetical protein